MILSLHETHGTDDGSPDVGTRSYIPGGQSDAQTNLARMTCRRQFLEAFEKQAKDMDAAFAATAYDACRAM